MVSVSGISQLTKAAGKLIFMDPEFSRIAEETLKTSTKSTNWRNIFKQDFKNIHTKVADCFIEAEKQTCNDSFWSNLWKKQILGFPKDIATAWKGSSGIWGTTKAIGGQLLHRLPLLFVAFELPNIFSAYKDEGLFGGTVELAKSATRFTASMAGFIVGQSLIPIPLVGGLLGAILTEKVTSLVLGKSHSEKKAEALAAAQNTGQQIQSGTEQLQQITGGYPYINQNQFAATNQYASPPGNIPQISVPRATMTPQQVMSLGRMLYAGGITNPMYQDFMSMTSGLNRLNYLC